MPDEEGSGGTGTGTGTGGAGSLNELSDVDLDSNISHGSFVAYNSSTARWENTSPYDFVDASLDGGDAASVYTEAFDIDGGYA